MSFNNIACVCGAGTLFGGSYLCLKKNPSDFEKRLAQLVTGISAVGLAFSCYKILDQSRVKSAVVEAPIEDIPLNAPDGVSVLDQSRIQSIASRP